MSDYTAFLEQSKTKVNDLISARNQNKRMFNANKERLENVKAKLEYLAEAKTAISFEIEDIQKTLKMDIDSLITIAIQSVYDRGITFALDFSRTPSGASTCKPIVIENGEEFNPKDEQCGGVLDVISYAMRIVLRGFEVNKSRDFIFFDEPFKFLGGGVLAERATRMMKKINDGLKIQSVIISHDEKCIWNADKIYHTTHDGYKSTTIEVHVKESPTKKKIKRIRADI